MRYTSVDEANPAVAPAPMVPWNTEYKVLEHVSNECGPLRDRSSWGGICTNNDNYSDLIHFYCHNISCVERSGDKDSPISMMGKIHPNNHDFKIYKIMICNCYKMLVNATPWSHENQTCMLFIAHCNDDQSFKHILNGYKDFHKMLDDKEKLRISYGENYQVFEEYPMFLIIIENDLEKVLESRGKQRYYYENYFQTIQDEKDTPLFKIQF